MAIQYTHDVIIQRPVEEVYTYISDVRNAPEWMPWADEIAVIEGSEPTGVAEGQRRLIKQTDFGIQSETVLKATEVTSGQGYTFESISGPVAFRGTYRFESIQEGTRLTRTCHVELPGLKRIMEPLMAHRMKRRWEADLKRVKKRLEAGEE